jgi:hypothetical protein
MGFADCTLKCDPAYRNIGTQTLQHNAAATAARDAGGLQRMRDMRSLISHRPAVFRGALKATTLPVRAAIDAATSDPLQAGNTCRQGSPASDTFRRCLMAAPLQRSMMRAHQIAVTEP